MNPESTTLDVKYDETQFEWGVIGPNGKWVDRERFSQRAHAEEHLDWLTKAATR